MRKYCGYPTALLMSCALALAACGGGGGGVALPTSAPAPVAAAPAATPTGGPLNLQAANTTVTYPAAASVGSASNGNLGGSSSTASGQGATVALTSDVNGNLTKVFFNIPALGFSQRFDADSGPGSLTAALNLGTVASFFGANTFGFLNTTSYFANQSYFATQSVGGQLLNASAYGLWGSNDSTIVDTTNASRFGGFAIGNLTPPASIPATGSATFTGTTIAIGGGGSVDTTLLGTAQIVSNFATGNVTANFTNFSTIPGQAGSFPNLSGTASISGNAYAGTVSGTGLTGSLNGNFYGTAAQETAGVWQASGGGNTWIGSYGAK